MTKIVFTSVILLVKYRFVYEVMWKKHGRFRQATDYNTVRCMRFACWMCKATDAFRKFNAYCSSTSNYLRESSSVLRHMFIVYLVNIAFINEIKVLWNAYKWGILNSRTKLSTPHLAYEAHGHICQLCIFYKNFTVR